ncbi:hypothetical protein D1AOALGA4SA_6806 [Olavius algarvensis Delta 1 endosymbiont]|nr:hypothetical protein D1AOALGA4SA_6806 [Olavius algarvensis Delta 1 endosymbiont]
MSDVRGQRTDFRGRRTDFRKQIAEFGNFQNFFLAFSAAL